MRLKSLLTMSMLVMSIHSFAQQTINLPQPNKKANSTSVIEALNTRHSTREFASTPLSQQELSNLCWAACGISRDDNHRTAPTARNKQEIRLFVFTKDGVFEYMAKENKLIKKVSGDQRDLLTSNGGNANFKQDFVLQAPVSLLMVIDFDIFGSNDTKSMQMGCVDAGIVSENINLYCQSVGLVTVPRATHDTDGIRKLLGFTSQQLPIMNNPVGKPKNH
ncbi:MAG: nitroreductase family protein [Bacteroidales bacterium]|nr:nitroreductase family protein [Bacteroidales bacterium]